MTPAETLTIRNSQKPAPGLYLSFRRRVILLSALVTVLLLPPLQRGGLSGFDDALYAYEARQMVETGDWSTPRLNGKPNFEFLPLFLWIEATSFQVFGVNDFAAKLPAAAMGIATMAMLAMIGAEITGSSWMGIWAMLVLALTQPFLKYSAHAMTDVPFTSFVTASWLLYLKSRRRPGVLLSSGLLIGAAILTRSILGLIPLVIISAHMVAGGRPYLRLLTLWLAALLAPLAWSLYAYHLWGTYFSSGHLSFLAAKSITPAGLSFQVSGYVRYMLRYYWPWAPVFAAGAFYQLRARSFASLLWAVALAAPAALSTTPYGRYLVPAFPAMALTCAVALNRWIPRTHRQHWFAAGCIVLAALAAYPWVFPAEERGVDMRTLAPIATRACPPHQRVLLYAHGEQPSGYLTQLLWYGRRDVLLLSHPEELARYSRPGAVAIVDAEMFARLAATYPPPETLARTAVFVCYRIPNFDAQ